MWSDGSGIINAVQFLDLVCSRWSFVELRHVSQAFLLSFVEFIFYWREVQRHLISRGISHFLSFVNVCCKSYIFTVVTLARSKMESPFRTIKSWLLHLSTFITQWNLLISFENLAVEWKSNLGGQLLQCQMQALCRGVPSHPSKCLLLDLHCSQ